MEDGYEVRTTPQKGEGLFATRKFNFREIVVRGEIEKRVDGNHSHASQIGENSYAIYAGLLSKINHSCEPNCGLQLNETGAHDFVAMKAINPNEELTFDYAMRNYNIDRFPEQCMCGSKKCRGRITGWKDLPESKKKEYADFAASYLFELDAKHLAEQKG